MRERGVRNAIGGLTVGAAMILFMPTFGSPVFSLSSHGSHGAPAAPSSVTLAAGSKSLDVAWTESTSGAFLFTATATSGGAPLSCVTATHHCKISGLDNGVVYDVSVIAHSVLSGSSAPSATASANVGAPGPPHSVRTVAGSAQTTVYWSAPRSTGVSKITGYVAIASPGEFSCSTSGTILSQPARTCAIPGLTTGVRYTVAVSAENAYGSGAPSASVMVTAK
jgi:hypothetical protein